jgi:hypothetical protein
VVFQVSDPVGPGETALLFGDGISPAVKAVGWRVPDAAVAAPPAKGVPGDAVAQPLEVLQASDLSAKVLLPADWKPGLFAVKLTSAGGTSDTIYLNRTKPWWWLGGENRAAFAGETIRVFGNNFGEKTRAWLTGNGSTVELPVLKAEKYAAEFDLPATLPPGDYALSLHNGYGGDAGFGGPLSVRVAKREPWPATQFNVRDFGALGGNVDARGECVGDDTPAFEAALAKAAASGGGVVFVPRGTYKITSKLVIPAKTVLRGERREWVWLYTPKDLPEFESVLAGNGDFAVEELSIASQTARRLVVCPDIPSVYSRARGHVPAAQYGHNAHLRRLMLQHVRYSHRARFPAGDPIKTELEGMTSIVLGGPDMEISDCDVVSAGGPFALFGAHRCRICGNHFGNGRCGAYLTWDAQEMLLENNVFEPRDNEGTGGGFQGRVYRLHFAGNTFHHIYGLDREALSFDSPYYVPWRGRAGKLDRNTLTTVEYSGAAKTWTPGALAGQACFIAFGKGLGQYIPVVDNSETTVTLAHPFAVPPDETSHLVFITMKTEAVVAGNAFSDASVAVQLYCQCYGLIVDGNRSERTGGMHGFGGGNGWSEQKKQYHFNICCFNQFLNNELSQGFVYQQGQSMNGIVGPCVEGVLNQPPAAVGIGNVVRNNRLRDNQIAGSMAARPHPFKLTPPIAGMGYVCRDTLIEGNTISDTPLALDVYPFHLDTLLRNNRVERAAHPLRDDGINTVIHPADRLGYQVQGVKLLLGEQGNLEAIERTVAELASKPTAAPGLAEQCARLRGQLWAAVARCRPQGITAETAALLIGLRWEFAPLQSLASGKAGKADVAVGVRTEPWSPPVDVKFVVPPPPGWQVADGDAVTVQPFQVVNLKSAVVLPAKADTKVLSVRFQVTLDGVPLAVVDRVDVGRRDLMDWMVIGPFANVSGTVPDPIIHPAETRLDLNAEYSGLTGPVKWQPVALSNKYLNMSKILGTSETATALAVTCLHADKAVPVELSLTCRGGLQVWLKDRLVVSMSPWGGKSLRLDLQEGDNILLCKSSVQTGLWELTAEFKELSPDAETHVRQVPLAEMQSIKSLAPPPAKAAKAGSLEHSGSVAWRLVLADDFDRRLLGNSWKIVSGNWSIRDGALVGQDPSFLAFTEKVPPPVRIEYDVRSRSPADLSCFWLRNPVNMGSGCLFAFASGEAGSRIVIEGSNAATSDSPQAQAVPNRWYHVIAQVLPSGKVQLFVDGQELLTAKSDVKAARGAYPGLWTWGGSQFNHVRIYSGPGR